MFSLLFLKLYTPTKCVQYAYASLKSIFKLDLAIKMFVHDPAESSFSEIIGMKTRFQWAEKILWDKVVKTTTGSYFKLSFKDGHTGQQL